MSETVVMDDDIYELLRGQVLNFRETESDVLRRLLSYLFRSVDCPKCGKAMHWTP